MSDNALLETISSAFIESAKKNGFNGVVASTLLRLGANEEALRVSIAHLIMQKRITAVFSRRDANMHIKRLPELSVQEQIELMESEELCGFALYPSESEVRQRVDLSNWQDRPFSQALLLAEPQLSFRAFDMGALERYVADPRYTVRFYDYMGRMSVSDEYFSDGEYPDRDKVSLQTFGLGFDKERTPYLVVYLRYLSGLSAEHQQYWKSFLTTSEVRMSEPYYRSSIEGDYWENRSVRYALAEEMRLIREMTEIIWGKSIFRPIAQGELPIGLTSFLRPTAENFNRFVMALDKLLSESIDKKFFVGKIPVETEREREDGKVEVQPKGTLTLLEEWLLKEIVWEDPAEFKKVVIAPLREVRRLRQTPAHSLQNDGFSTEFRRRRKQVLWAVLNSLSSIRGTFARHPNAGNIKIPEWLDAEPIDVF
jgi:hypothetical protein